MSWIKQSLSFGSKEEKEEEEETKQEDVIEREEQQVEKEQVTEEVEEAPPPPQTVVEGSTATAEKNQEMELQAARKGAQDDDEEAQVSEKQQQQLELSFENLSVFVPSSKKKSCCSCIDNPLQNFAAEYMGVGLQNTNPFYALDVCSAHIKEGEMCLVLGTNDASKSSLIRAVAGRTNTTDQVTGSLNLNGMPLSKAHQGWRRMNVYVAATDATHAPVLTVKETIEFAAQCTSDGHLTKQELEERTMHILTLLGLDHVKDTVVGDENIRGVSGGQKRRVTVGEMFTDANSKFFCLENITDGLASTDSIKLINNLARASKEFGLGGFISLLQPSDVICKLFDKLLVLTSQGELMYFGPVDRAVIRSIFLGKDDANNESSQQKDEGSICDLVLSQTNEVDVMRRYLSSSVYTDLVQELAQIRIGRRETNLEALLPPNKYSTNRWYQFRIIAKRKAKLIARNAVTFTRALIAIVFGIIIGSLFSVLQNDIAGSLARTGYIFLNSFLVLMLSSAITIPDCFRQRVTVFKHRSAEFFSGRVSYLVQVFLDMPLSILEATLLSTISYFWVDMNSGADKFFYFWGCLVGLECVGQSYARLLSALVRKQVSASALSSISILICGTVGGFMPTYGQIPWVLRWLSWVTPVAYAFEGMMINEFAGRTYQGIGIGDQPPMLPGESWLRAYNLPRADWGSLDSIKIFDLCMLFVWSILYDLIGFYFVEHTRGWSLNQTRRPQARVRSDFLNYSSKGGGQKVVTDSQHMEESAEVRQSQSDSSTTTYPTSLAVKDLVYKVPLAKAKKRRCTKESIFGPLLIRMYGKKTQPKKEDEEGVSELTLLNNVDAFFHRGKMTALMGPSGCGKTTLMDVIAGYKTGGTIEGSILMDGKPKNDALWKKIAGYAEQMDILNPYLSVMETLRFTALCRLGTKADVNKVIDQVVKLMALQEWTDMVVGRELEGEGLPKHARKRLTIAVQLVGKPKILFLDEPTTGLGTKAASLVTKAIRRSTDALGLITVATIHQPSKLIWDAFDQVLLLTKGGKVAYMGDMGENSQTVLSHFAGMTDSEPPTACNPADYVLECLNDVSIDQATSAFAESDSRQALLQNIEESKSKGGEEPPVGGKVNNFFVEFGLLFKRHIITQWRNPSYSFTRFTSSVVMSIYLGILFYGDKQSSIQGAVASIGAVFFFVFLLVIPMQAGVVPLVEDRAVLYRETVSGTYSRFTYGLGMLFADFPFHLLNTVLMFVSFYFLAGFGQEGDRIGYFFLLLLMANMVILSMGQLYALVTPNEESANGLAGLSIILSVILMGFLITVDAMPQGWRWAYWSNLLRYMLQGFVTNELAGTTYTVDIAGLLTPPRNNTDGSSTSAASNTVTIYGPGEDAEDARTKQSATLLNLIAQAGDGKNDPSKEDLSKLVECLVDNNCLEDPVFSSLISCITVFDPTQTPVCQTEFDKATEGIDVNEIKSCFPDVAAESNETFSRNLQIVPDNFTLTDFEELPSEEQEETGLCLVQSFSPMEEPRSQVAGIFDDLWDIILVVIDILENGIQLPGELILFFFSWAKEEDGEFVAPWKWWYCMFSVAVFLVAIELFKLIAVCKIVWIKR